MIFLKRVEVMHTFSCSFWLGQSQSNPILKMYGKFAFSVRNSWPYSVIFISFHKIDTNMAIVILWLLFLQSFQPRSILIIQYK